MRLNRLLTTAAALALTASAAVAQTSAATKSTTKPTAAPAAVASTPVSPTPDAAVPATGASLMAAPARPRVVAKGDLVETARSAGQFNTFMKAVDATNLTQVLKTNKNLTVFAPTDAAFAALPAGELDRLMADKAAMQKLLTYHIVNARVDSTKIKGAKGPVATVAGAPVELDGSGDMLMVNNAHIAQPDVITTNGVLHVIDKVLTPAGAMAAGASGASASATATDSAASPSTDAAGKPAATKAAPN